MHDTESMSEAKTEGALLLVVEDNPINQKIVSRALSKLGFVVDLAKDGVEGSVAAQNKAYDLIIMDIMMPNMDGFSATEAIRKEGLSRNTPIVALTADTTEACKKRCMNSGMDRYMTKPLNFGELKNVLSELIAAQ